jgi:outer membrane protein assembly factor BamA
VSCNSTKHVGENDFLIKANTIETGVDTINQNTLKPYLDLKPNAKFLLGIPLKLHLYNLAKQEPDTVFISWLQKKPNRQKRLTNFLSEKQLKNLGEFYVGLNNGLKKSGQAPSILNQKKINKSIENLKGWYYNHGWLNASVDYNVKKDTAKKKAEIFYKVDPKQAYFIDSISTNIASKDVDSLYNGLKSTSLVKEGEQFITENFNQERLRIEKYMKNNGVYHFDREYISFIVDSIKDNPQQLDVELNIKNREVKLLDTTYQLPFEIYRLTQVNVFTDYVAGEEYIARDSVNYGNMTFFAKEKIQVSPKILADAIFMKKDDVYREQDRIDTYNRFSNIRVFEYPDIRYQEDPRTPGENNLISNVFLTPKKRFGFSPNFEVSQSNIQDFGIGLNTSFLARNALGFADVLELSFRANLGSSSEIGNTQDQFFNINEFGGNLSLSLPKIIFPFAKTFFKRNNTQPFTRITYGFSTQENIGLDRQNHLFKFDYNWNPNRKTSKRLGLIDFQFVNNLNVNNYFNIFTNSYSELNQISRDNLSQVNPDFLNTNNNLTIPTGTDGFIANVQNNSINLTQDENQLFNSIVERKDRLSENNLIIASNYTYDYSTRENINDENYFQFRSRFEVAGNLMQALSKALNLKQNNNDQYLMFDVPFSQYAKMELSYIKHWDLDNKNIIATRMYGGIALPFGNSNSIPFARSFFGGGPNDNRGWQPYDLGPGKTNGVNDFNEANFKLSFNFEYRFNVFGNLNSALFIDAGNIWNVLDNIEDRDATFDGFRDLADLSIATGFGLRYDISFLVIRLDFGFKTYNPGDPDQKWFNDYDIKSMVFNFGINYPF